MTEASAAPTIFLVTRDRCMLETRNVSWPVSGNGKFGRTAPWYAAGSVNSRRTLSWFLRCRRGEPVSFLGDRHGGAALELDRGVRHCRRLAMRREAAASRALGLPHCAAWASKPEGLLSEYRRLSGHEPDSFALSAAPDQGRVPQLERASAHKKAFLESGDAIGSKADLPILQPRFKAVEAMRQSSSRWQVTRRMESQPDSHWSLTG